MQADHEVLSCPGKSLILCDCVCVMHVGGVHVICNWIRMLHGYRDLSCVYTCMGPWPEKKISLKQAS